MKTQQNIKLNSYQHFDDYQKSLNKLNEFLISYFKTDLQNVLEAGCGSASWLDIILKRASNIVGIDISKKQLDRNKLIHQKVLADLQNYENSNWSNFFALIICWDVLEHLSDPKKVVLKFIEWLRPGGLAVLAYPNPQTLKGFITKYSPYWFHKLFYRIVSGTPMNSDIEDIGPFKTIFNKDLNLIKILEIIESKNCTLEWFASVESYQQKYLKKFLPNQIIILLNKIFLGSLRKTLNPNATDFVMIIKKNK